MVHIIIRRFQRMYRRVAVATKENKYLEGRQYLQTRLEAHLLDVRIPRFSVSLHKTVQETALHSASQMKA